MPAKRATSQKPGTPKPKAGSGKATPARTPKKKSNAPEAGELLLPEPLLETTSQDIPEPLAVPVVNLTPKPAQPAPAAVALDPTPEKAPPPPPPPPPPPAEIIAQPHAPGEMSLAMRLRMIATAPVPALQEIQGSPPPPLRPPPPARAQALQVQPLVPSAIPADKALITAEKSPVSWPARLRLMAGHFRSIASFARALTIGILASLAASCLILGGLIRQSLRRRQSQRQAAAHARLATSEQFAPAAALAAEPKSPDLVPPRWRYAFLAAFTGLLLITGCFRDHIGSALAAFSMGTLHRSSDTILHSSNGWLFPRQSSPPDDSGLTSALNETGIPYIVLTIDRSRMAAEKAGISSSGYSPALPGELLTDKVWKDMAGTDNVPLFSAKDRHWSPQAVQKAAALLAAHIQSLPWYAGMPLNPALGIIKGVQSAPASGSLAEASGMTSATFSLPLVRILTADGKPLEPDHESPIAITGDSSLAVYDDAAQGWTAQGLTPEVKCSAGLAQHLSFLLGLNVDVHTAQDAATAVREWSAARGEASVKARKLLIVIRTR